MTRSFLLSALVLALAAAMPACGGEAGTPDAKSPDQPGGEPAASEGDAFDQLKALTDGIQADVDGLLQPVNDASAAVDAIGDLPKSLKGAKKFDQKKFLKEAAKVAGGGDPAVEALKFDPDTTTKVTDALTKLKAAVAALDPAALDTKVKALTDKLTSAPAKLTELSGKVVAQATLVAKNPLKSADEKKKAEEKLKAVTDLKDSFTKKAADWSTTLKDVPTKAKAAKDKLAAFATAK